MTKQELIEKVEKAVGVRYSDMLYMKDEINSCPPEKFDEVSRSICDFLEERKQRIDRINKQRAYVAVTTAWHF